MVDKYNEQPVSAYMTQGGAVFMLLHNSRAEDAVRHFFQEVHELFVKVRRRAGHWSCGAPLPLFLPLLLLPRRSRRFCLRPQVTLNPFQWEDGPIASSTFDARVRTLASKHLS